MIWRGVVFRDYEAAGLDRFEVCVADGVITANPDTLPDEMTAYQARLVANLLVAAACELEPPETFTAKGRGGEVMTEDLKAARSAFLNKLMSDSMSLMEVPEENFGLYGRYPPKPDTRSKWRRSADEVRYRITGAWACLMGRGE